MKNNYNDIINVAGQPKWHDTNGVPRYNEFSPASVTRDLRMDVCGYIVLAEIKCASCEEKYNVAIQLNKKDFDISINTDNKEYLSDKIGYGDPPYHCTESCGCGYSLSAIPLKIIEFWERNNWNYNKINKLFNIEICN